jgi:hypothetical protein
MRLRFVGFGSHVGLANQQASMSSGRIADEQWCPQ